MSGVLRRSKSSPPDLGFMVPLRVHRGSWDTGGMFRVEIYGRVRRAVLVEGRSQREVARECGISRKTVQKMLRYAVPPGYQRQQPVK